MKTRWDEASVSHHHADVGGVRLHYVEAGKGPLVVLLHGFPEFWYSWRHQIPALAAAGYRVVAPDMRGYNLSDKPPRIDDYRVGLLAEDVAGLIRALGEEKAIVAGHDWGGAVAWFFAMHHEDLLDALVILNCPHPATFKKGLKTFRQLLKSWYMGFFQIPRLPELIAGMNDFAMLRKSLKGDPIQPGAVNDDDEARYVEAFRQPGALTAMINYYRAAFGAREGGRSEPRFRTINLPVLVIWGEKDRYLGLELSEPEPKWVPNVRVERIPDGSHFIHYDRPERVNHLLLDFLAGLEREAPRTAVAG